MIICGPNHCTVPQPFLQPADEPHLAVRADLCQGLGCGTPQPTAVWFGGEAPPSWLWDVLHWECSSGAGGHPSVGDL